MSSVKYLVYIYQMYIMPSDKDAKFNTIKRELPWSLTASVQKCKVESGDPDLDSNSVKRNGMAALDIREHKNFVTTFSYSSCQHICFIVNCIYLSFYQGS